MQNENRYIRYGVKWKPDREWFIEDYGIDLEGKYDKTDGTNTLVRLFCLDCPRYYKGRSIGYRPCKGVSRWKRCEFRKEGLAVINGE